MSHEVKFAPSGRGKAQCDPNPDFPEGIALDATRGQTITCLVKLPYPAPECGMWLVKCQACGIRVMVTAAGRMDDPVSIKLPCDVGTTVQ
jgi:hypothetical protein